MVRGIVVTIGGDGFGDAFLAMVLLPPTFYLILRSVD
jgi:hypothetical protein